MIVEQYLDHLAYTFEKEDEMFMLGMKIVNKLGNDLIPMVKVSYNGSDRLLYGLDDLKPVHEIVDKLNDSELAFAFSNFIKLIKSVEDNDYLKAYGVDINYNRLFYDIKNKKIKAVILPINYECNLHDGLSWSKSFRRSILILLNKIFINSKEKYSEAYYYIMDEEKSDSEIIKYASSLEFGVRMVDSSDVFYEKKHEENGLILEHRSAIDNIVFVVSKSGFVLGKGKDADGTFNVSSNVSRRHCEIAIQNGTYMVKDLGSTNGTTINGFTLNPNQYYYIKNGDKLKLADVEFVVTIRQ